MATIPGKHGMKLLMDDLAWAPSLRALSPDDCPDGFYPFGISSDECSDQNVRGGIYSVPHYTQESLGLAYGPLALDQTLAFCCKLKMKLAAHGKVVVCGGDVPDRTNAAVLVGAFLLLLRGWTCSM